MKLIDLKLPLAKVHWRAQTLTKDGRKAMALAFMDARDVMNRFDEVCGPENWSDSYCETPSGRVICTLSVLIGDKWVSKSDGAGSTDIEGDKGGLSDALKRAAVKWGVGRYLYDMEPVWAECESYKKGDRFIWKKWTVDGLARLNKAHQSYESAEVGIAKTTLQASLRSFRAELVKANTIAALDDVEAKYAASLDEESRSRVPEYFEGLHDDCGIDSALQTRRSMLEITDTFLDFGQADELQKYFISEGENIERLGDTLAKAIERRYEQLHSKLLQKKAA